MQRARDEGKAEMEAAAMTAMRALQEQVFKERNEMNELVREAMERAQEAEGMAAKERERRKAEKEHRKRASSEIPFFSAA